MKSVNINCHVFTLTLFSPGSSLPTVSPGDLSGQLYLPVDGDLRGRRAATEPYWSYSGKLSLSLYLRSISLAPVCYFLSTAPPGEARRTKLSIHTTVYLHAVFLFP